MVSYKPRNKNVLVLNRPVFDMQTFFSEFGGYSCKGRASVLLCDLVNHSTDMHYNRQNC